MTKNTALELAQQCGSLNSGVNSICNLSSFKDNHFPQTHDRCGFTHHRLKGRTVQQYMRMDFNVPRPDMAVTTADLLTLLKE